MINELEIIGREEELFSNDLINFDSEVNIKINSSKFLVIGAGGSIGQAVTKEIASRNPKSLHCIDINENALAELVRDIRSSNFHIKDLKTFVVDIGSEYFVDFINSSDKFDYILNLSAMKHVRSEKDPYSLMRMIDTNIFYTKKSVELAIASGTKNYFCVSTDKAANPVNLMGASKKIMELYLSKFSDLVDITSARFANVAFSNGSLLESFSNRLNNRQPIAGPSDIERYFVTTKESGILCMLSCLLGKDKEIFFPKLSKNLRLISIEEVASKFLASKGFKIFSCSSEEEAKSINIDDLINKNLWPCYFSSSNTSGEKSFEEFFTNEEDIFLQKFEDIGIVKNKINISEAKLAEFENSITDIKKSTAKKQDIVLAFNKVLDNFQHIEKSKNLDEKM